LIPDIDRWREAILFVIALVASTAVHEFGHAWVATRLGDSLPRAQGRLTLNPIKHADLFGTFLIPLVLSLSTTGMAFGYGRPVLTNPSSYTRRVSRPTGQMLVAVAGPLMNLVMAIVVSLIVVVGLRSSLMGETLANGLVQYLIALNLLLLYVNLFPIPPLDGGRVLAWVLPRSMQGAVDFLTRWGFLILIGIMIIPGVLEVLLTPARLLTSYWIEGLRHLL
jgi:Zn-dependent protease